MKKHLLTNTIFENINLSNGLFKKHFHNTYTIGITHDGLFKSNVENKTDLSYKNSTRIINPYDIHNGDSQDWKYTNFYPSIELMSSIAEDMCFEKKLVLFSNHIINDNFLYNLLLKLFKSIYTNNEIIEIEINTLETLAYLIENYANVKNINKNYFDDKKLIIKSIEYINDELDSNLLLEEIAKKSSLSKFHFLRIFKKYIGLTPHQYIMSQRINKAKNLIINGDNLIVASNKVGFYDQSHFIKSFRKLYGYSPKLLQKKDNFVIFK